MICENCEGLHDGTFGSGRFCSIACSRAFSTKNKRSDINVKVSSSLKGKNFMDFEKRSKIMNDRWKNYEFTEEILLKLSNVSKAMWNNSEYRENMKTVYERNVQNRTNGIKLAVREGRWHGWTISPSGNSYAEKYFETLFDSLDIKYRREVKIGKYFVDFLFNDSLILEVDGKQHNTIDHIEKDKVRDEFLISQGYSVFRISWKNVNHIEGRTLVHTQINVFLNKFAGIL